MALGEDVDAGDPDLPEVAPLHAGGRIYASSMGLGFAVAQEVHQILVTVEWGHYRKVESATYLTKDESAGRLIWKRFPVKSQTEITLAQTSYDAPVQADFLDIRLKARIKNRKDRRVIDLALVNCQEPPSSNKAEKLLFQPKLTVTALDGSKAIFCPMSDPLEHGDHLGRYDSEDRHLAILYRDHLEYAVGRNVAVEAEAEENERRASRLTTTWLPTYDIPQTVPPTVGDTPQLHGLELRMDKLAELPRDELLRCLAPLADGYAGWLADRETDIERELPGHLQETAMEALRRAENISGRIRAGIECLRYSEDAFEAFRFANQAMAMQRRHTDIVRERANDPKTSFEAAYAKVREKDEPAWRPFQLAFVLLNLPTLTDPRHPERAANHDAVVDLLFFPTGGGKTEAYLGLTAYTLAIRRLQGLVGTGEQQRDGSDGTAVLMRYTLRLLTAQQFQRAAALVCACEQLRSNDKRLGDKPFRIGLWVGVKVSPNWYPEAARQVEQARDGRNVRASALQILNCPWCGTELRADRDLFPDAVRRRIIIFCGDPDGQCPFSRRRRPTEGLPILTVDEEIYRLTPGLVIATVDKLAQLPWKGYAGHLFGRVSRWCPRHGYRHADMDARTGCKKRHNRQPGAEPVQEQAVVRLRPPDLIIQDELHLISGALGTTVGLFEAAVDELCTWRIGDDEIGPKIIASTATVKRAREQVHQLFARQLAIFPPPVLDQGDTFFSRQVPVTKDTPGRRYLGVCAHGVRLKSAEIRLSEILFIAVQTLLDRYGEAADPYLTLVGYFNATRELAGMRRYVDDDIATRVRRNGRRRGLSDRLVTLSDQLRVQELTSRVSSAVIAQALRQLEARFDPAYDSTTARRAVVEEYKRAKAERREPVLPPRRDFEPLDVVLATSMLQVGVDVSRLGLMVMTGQPKNTAEYIQASSRVGRDAARPGLVVTLYNWARPRDLAHYEHFAHYHASVYKEVEALSVTPFARRALDREFAGAFVAAVRNLEERYSHNRDAQDVSFGEDPVTRVRRRFRERASYVTGSAYDGGGYLDEKAKALLDLWASHLNPDFRLGYEAAKSQTENIAGLLKKPAGEWTALTVSQSMRETENEINLLLPRQTLVDVSAAEGPRWRFGTDQPETDDEDTPQTDELGEISEATP
jgi:hypothetical protein